MTGVRLADLNGPKWTPLGQNGPKWTILVHFGLANANIRFRNKVILTKMVVWTILDHSLRLLNALNSEDRALKVRFSLATIAFDRESAQMSQILSSQGKNAPSDPLSSLFSAFSNLKVLVQYTFRQYRSHSLKFQDLEIFQSFGPLGRCWAS